MEFLTNPPEIHNSTDTIPDYYTLHKKAGLRTTVGITCILSIAGSMLIILSYVLFRDLRTKARLILVHISLADFGVAVANLFGIAYQFDRFYQPYGNASSQSVDTLCKAQAFVAHFSTISSVLWTMTLAAHMYNVVMKLSHEANKENKWFVPVSCIICYGFSSFVNVWMICTNKLGFSPHDTYGWCGTIMHAGVEDRSIDYMSLVFGYYLWIFLTFAFIIVIYLALHFYVRREVNIYSELP